MIDIYAKFIDLAFFGNLKVTSERSLKKLKWWLLNGFGPIFSPFYDIPSVKYCVENDCVLKKSFYAAYENKRLFSLVDKYTQIYSLFSLYKYTLWLSG